MRVVRRTILFSLVYIIYTFIIYFNLQSIRSSVYILFPCLQIIINYIDYQIKFAYCFSTCERTALIYDFQAIAQIAVLNRFTQMPLANAVFVNLMQLTRSWTVMDNFDGHFEVRTQTVQSERQDANHQTTPPATVMNFYTMKSLYGLKMKLSVIELR